MIFFPNGKTVCEGYSRLYIELAEYLGLMVKYIAGYAKEYGYEPGNKLGRPDHAYNAIKLDNNWYLLDPTWGACNYEKKNKNKKNRDDYNDYYFCTDPELLIRSHFPKQDNWKLNILDLRKYLLFLLI